MLQTVITVLHLIFSLGLIAFVLLQSGRSAGLSGAIAGGAEHLFGKKKRYDDLFVRVSTGFAIAFIVSALTLSILVKQAYVPPLPLDVDTSEMAPPAPGADTVPPAGGAGATPPATPTTPPATTPAQP